MLEYFDTNQPPDRAGRIRVDLGDSFTNTFSNENWELIDRQHIRGWEAARDRLSRRSFKVRDGRIDIFLDFESAIRRVKRNNFIERFRRNHPDAHLPFPKSPTSLKVDFRFFGHLKPSVGDHYFGYYISYILYDFFLIMNIANPASLDMNNAKIKAGYLSKENLGLSNTLFDISTIDGTAGKWPSVGFVPLEMVIEWFSLVRNDVTLIPKSRSERVLFSILHICRSPTNPSTIIWIFYALEALFDTKPGENFRALTERIGLLLGPTSSQAKLLKKQMRSLYDLRSSFVHGGMEVAHPLDNEIIDASVGDAFIRLSKGADLGFRIILSCLQEVIRRQIKEPSFKEIIL